MMSRSHEEAALARQHTWYVPACIAEWEGASLEGLWLRSASCWRILIVTKGIGVIAERPAGRGCIWLVPPESPLELEQVQTLQGVLIGYRCLAPDGGEALLGLSHPQPLASGSTQLLRLADELADLWKCPDSEAPFRLQQTFATMLAELEKARQAALLPESDWLSRTLKIMQEQYNSDLTREQLARQAQVSPQHFSRAFRKRTGFAWTDYLTLLRIRHAQLQLLGSSDNLDTVASQVGYKEGLYLSRRFKATVGISPARYRNQTQRFAALNFNHTASLIALGLQPVLGDYSPWLEGMQRRHGPVQQLRFAPIGPNREAWYRQIASVQPDVIVHYSDAPENDRLLPLAPVLEIPFKTMNWREQFRYIADIANRSALAEQWLEQFDERLQLMQARLYRDWGRRATVAVWELGDDKAYGISSSFGRGCQLLYSEFGFRPPERMLREGIEDKGYIETEIGRIADYAAEHIFILGKSTMWENLLRSESWSSLEAVKAGRVYRVERSDMFYGFDPLSSQAQLTEMMRHLTGAELQ
ncbi:Fe3+-hydroxamate ABC transporter substrate-binding protein [Paenibacillus sp. 598K]|uniref:AraC family transcriptional regulator n=1 Tax=Paenibacillus sp. 598K TaxID=1117987 RepID=UPI000FF9E979|nr:AraC family transcriptional regulator [Paenibacillus sp. 598K]GBF73370.1 Fe3+-hydroxamate ABC transporter substrate-binding protein [Paenibacillus sp. 598K]